MAKAARKIVSKQQDIRALLPAAYEAIDNPRRVVTEEYRALEMMDVVPEGCVAYRDGYGLCNPHIKPGDFAIAATNEREPINGEIYLLRWSNGTCSVLQLRQRNDADGRPSWWFGPMRGSAILASSDGPYDDDVYLRSKILGRVIGVLVPVGRSQ